ncbi:hypothetical protein AB0O34_35535 [Sphaerisporangium sp. NPDC088356]|uniref:zinc finger domain-containing protein n=1 Tax=Sphaerisporangium sp. NPDC088356 TaxID=3154871 RepID=UPI00342273F3
MTFFDVPWEVGKEATEAIGTSRNEVLEALWDWYLRTPGAELPERPPADLLEGLFSKWQAREDGIRELALTLACPTCKATSGPCLAGKAKKPKDDLIHRPRLAAATALYDAQQAGIHH